MTEEQAFQYFQSLEQKYKNDDEHNRFPKFFCMLDKEEQQKILEAKREREEKEQLDNSNNLTNQ